MNNSGHNEQNLGDRRLPPRAPGKVGEGELEQQPSSARSFRPFRHLHERGNSCPRATSRPCPVAERCTSFPGRRARTTSPAGRIERNRPVPSRGPEGPRPTHKLAEAGGGNARRAAVFRRLMHLARGLLASGGADEGVRIGASSPSLNGRKGALRQARRSCLHWGRLRREEWKGRKIHLR